MVTAVMADDLEYVGVAAFDLASCDVDRLANYPFRGDVRPGVQW